MSFQIHHIKPKWKGGSDDPSNLIKVTHTQHIMWHWCEWQRTGEFKDHYAYNGMRGFKPVGGWNKGIPMKESTKSIQRAQRLGKPNRNSGNNSWKNRTRAKSAVVINTKTGDIWCGVISDIARELGLNQCHLQAVAGGHRSQHRGFIAAYH